MSEPYSPEQPSNQQTERKQTKLVHLPRYHFREVTNPLSQLRLSRKAHFELPQDPEKRTPERDRQIKEIATLVDQFARDELGIDLHRRLRKVTNDFHFYDKDTYNRVREQLGLPISEGHLGFTLGSGDMIVLEQPSELATIATTNHELMHRISPGVISRADTIDVSVSAYTADTGETLAFDEALREITNMELRMIHWEGNPILDPVRFGPTLYPWSLVVADELIKKIATKRQQSYKEVLRHLQRGMVMGRNDELSVVISGLNDEEKAIFFNWQDADSPEQAIKVAQGLGLVTAADKLDNYREGQTIRWFDSFKPNFALTAQRAN